MGTINFKALARLALKGADSLVPDLLPNGKRDGNEWIALNPHREDKSLGSFRVNLRNGKWADFATNDRGGDLVSLVAFVRQTGQVEAARTILAYFGGRQ